MPDGRRSSRRVDVYGRSRKEVIEKMQDVAVRARSGLGVLDRRMTFGALIDTYFDRGVPRRISAKTKRDNRSVAKHLQKHLGHVRVLDLLPLDITDLCYDLLDDGYSPSTVARVRSIAGQALRWAEAQGIVQRNVARLADPISYEALDRSAEHLTPEEVLRFVDACDGHPLGAAAAGMVMMGMRPGEILGLPWGNVDFEVNVLRIEQSLKNHPDESGKYHLFVADVKRARNAHRTLAIPTRFAEMLIKHRDDQGRLRLRSGPNWKGNDHDLVFTTTVGTPVDPARIRKAVKQIASKAGITKNVVPYDGRRTNVSLLSDADVDPVRIADVEGHDPRTALGVYRRRMRPVIDAHVEPINSFFGTSSSGRSEESRE